MSPSTANHLKKPLIIGVASFLLLIVIVSVAYLLTRSNDQDPSYGEDPITGQSYLQDMPTSDGSNDDSTAITGLAELRARGMGLDQTQYFNNQVLEFINQSDVEHDVILKIQTDSIERSSADGIVTKFRLYITDDTYYQVELRNDYAQLQTVDVTLSDTTGTMLFEKAG